MYLQILLELGKDNLLGIDILLSLVLGDLDKEADLIGDILEGRVDDTVTLGETMDMVRQTNLVAELPDKGLGATKVVAGHAWEQMVDGLELETAVEPVQPGRAVDIHGGAEHLCCKGLGVAQLLGRHAEMRERDLDVEHEGEHVRDKDVGDDHVPGGELLNKVRVPDPVDAETEDFLLAVRVDGFRGQEGHRLDVEVEATEHHDGIVEVVLVRNKELSRPVKDHFLLMVGREEALEDASRHGKEGQVLDIGVVDRVVGDNVVDVVRLFPPSNREATEEVC